MNVDELGLGVTRHSFTTVVAGAEEESPKKHVADFGLCLALMPDTAP